MPFNLPGDFTSDVFRLSSKSNGRKTLAFICDAFDDVRDTLFLDMLTLSLVDEETASSTTLYKKQRLTFSLS